jgi:hypothetical protein
VSDFLSDLNEITKLPSVNPLSSGNVENWFCRLGLLDNHNSLVGVRIVHVMDWKESTVHGMKFTHSEVTHT